MLLRRSIAPMPDLLHREKERRRRTKQSCPVVPSTAAYFERLMSLAGETPRENASFCDPDKAMMQRQENTVRIASSVCALSSAHSECFSTAVSSARDGEAAAGTSSDHACNQVRSVDGSLPTPRGNLSRLACAGR